MIRSGNEYHYVFQMIVRTLSKEGFCIYCIINGVQERADYRLNPHLFFGFISLENVLKEPRTYQFALHKYEYSHTGQ